MRRQLWPFCSSHTSSGSKRQLRCSVSLRWEQKPSLSSGWCSCCGSTTALHPTQLRKLHRLLWSSGLRGRLKDWSSTDYSLYFIDTAAAMWTCTELRLGDDISIPASPEQQLPTPVNTSKTRVIEEEIKPFPTENIKGKCACSECNAFPFVCKTSFHSTAEGRRFSSRPLAAIKSFSMQKPRHNHSTASPSLHSSHDGAKSPICNLFLSKSSGLVDLP